MLYHPYRARPKDILSSWSVDTRRYKICTMTANIERSTSNTKSLKDGIRKIKLRNNLAAVLHAGTLECATTRAWSGRGRTSTKTPLRKPLRNLISSLGPTGNSFVYWDYQSLCDRNKFRRTERYTILILIHVKVTKIIISTNRYLRIMNEVLSSEIELSTKNTEEILHANSRLSAVGIQGDLNRLSTLDKRETQRSLPLSLTNKDSLNY